MDKKSENNTYGFSDEEIQMIDLFQKYIPKVLSKIKGKKTKVIDEVDGMVDPSLNPTLIGFNDKDIDVIEQRFLLVRSCLIKPKYILRDEFIFKHEEIT